MTLYVLVIDGHVITEPMTMEAIIDQFGSVRDLERTGVRIRAIQKAA